MHFVVIFVALIFVVVVLNFDHGTKLTPHTLPAIPLLNGAYLLGGDDAKGSTGSTMVWFYFWPWSVGRSVGRPAPEPNEKIAPLAALILLMERSQRGNLHHPRCGADASVSIWGCLWRKRGCGGCGHGGEVDCCLLVG